MIKEHNSVEEKKAALMNTLLFYFQIDIAYFLILTFILFGSMRKESICTTRNG